MATAKPASTSRTMPLTSEPRNPYTAVFRYADVDDDGILLAVSLHPDDFEALGRPTALKVTLEAAGETAPPADHAWEV